MPREIYTHWHDFLRNSVIGTELASEGCEEDLEIFCACFDLKQEHLLNRIVRHSVTVSLRISASKYDERIKYIYRCLESKVNFQKKEETPQTKDKVETRRADPMGDIWRWLKEAYPDWRQRFDPQILGIEDLWKKLKSLGLYEERKIGIYINPTSDNQTFLQKIIQDTRQVKLKITSSERSKVIVINRDREGSEAIYCVCPSKLAPNINLWNGGMIIPQDISEYSEIETTITGKQDLLCCIFDDDDLELTWIEEAKKYKKFQLKVEDLTELLIQIELQNGKIFYTYYEVVEKSPPTKSSSEAPSIPSSIFIKTLENNSSTFSNPLFQAAVSLLLKYTNHEDVESREELQYWLSESILGKVRQIQTELRDPDDLIRRFIIEGVFVNDLKARLFLLDNKYDVDSVSETEQKKSLINIPSDLGDELLKLVDSRVKIIELNKEHRRFVEKCRRKINSPDPMTRIDGLKEFYDLCTKNYRPDQMDSFVISDFDRDFWKGIIFQPQRSLAEDKWNHLHRANKIIGEEVGKLLKIKLRKDSVDSSNDRIIRIIEGGVGGLNTTLEVIKGIMTKVEVEEPRMEIQEIQYKGFEINPAIAAFAESIFTSSNLREDPRSQYFTSLQDKSKLKPLDTSSKYSQFIFTNDMFAGIQEMSKTYHNHIDVFICSYALHHVPNGETLRNALFNGDLHEDKRITWKNNRRFFEGLLDELNRMKSEKNQYNLPQEKSPELQAFLALFPKDQPLIDCDIDKIIKSINLSESQPWIREPDWTKTALVNRQELLLSWIGKMLKSNGLIAIADPDGYSKFNQKNILSNPEMGVANFLNPISIDKLLVDCGFEVLMNKTQIKIEGDFSEDTVKISGDSFAPVTDNNKNIDLNLGYITIARKITKEN